MAVLLAAAIVLTLVVGARHLQSKSPLPASPEVLKGIGSYPITGGDLVYSSRAWNFFFHSPDEAALVVDGHPLITHDGGKTWLSSPATFFFGGMQWIDSQHIYFWGLNTNRAVHAGSVVEETSDGGAHWQFVTLNRLFDPTESFFVTPTEGWSLQWGCQASSPCTVNHTIDGGAHWQEVATVGPDPAVAGLGVVFVDANRGFVGSVSQADGVGRVYLTRDGGVNWTAVTLPAPAGGWQAGANLVEPPQLFGLDGILVDHLPGGPTLLYSTTDFGATWADPRALPTTVQPDATPAFRNAYEGWVVDGPGDLLRTLDGGKSWTNVPTNVPGGLPFLSVTPVGGHALWGVVHNGNADYAVRSSDDGVDWTLVTLPSPGHAGS